MFSLSRHLLAAVMVAATDASFAIAQAPAKWTATQELRIKGEDAELTPILWMGVSKDGTIFVSQPQDSKIRLFSATGTSAGTIGRKGQGPGEFQTIVAALGWVGDTLWAYDPALNRFSFFTPQGKFLRSFNLVAVKPAPRDSLKFRRYPFFYPTAINAKGSVLGRGDGGRSAGDNSSVIKPLQWVRASSEGIVENVIGNVASGETSARLSIPNGTASVTVPFAVPELTSANSDGSRIAAVTVAMTGTGAQTYAVSVIGPNGDTLVSRRYPFSGVRIPKQLIDSALNHVATRTRSAEIRAAVTGTLVRDKVPPFYSPVTTVLYGRDDTIWLGLHSSTDLRQWLVLDAKGAMIAQVEFPSAFVARVADRAQVWGTQKDADDVEDIVRYRVKPR